jgi:hypothetical protein
VNGMDLGAGLAALGFWLFMAVVIIAGIWATVRRREMQNQLVQRMIDSGQKIDQEVLDRIFPPGGAARSVGIVLVFFGLFMAGMGIAADISYPAVAFGALTMFAGAFIWIRAGR